MYLPKLLTCFRARRRLSFAEVVNPRGPSRPRAGVLYPRMLGDNAAPIKRLF